MCLRAASWRATPRGYLGRSPTERRSVRILLPVHLEGWHDAYQVGRPMTPGTIAHLGGPFDHFALPFADSALSDGESRLGRRGSPTHCCRRFYKSAGNSDTLIDGR